MKPCVFFVLCCICSFLASAQSELSLHAGVGTSTAYKHFATPTFGIDYLGILDRRFKVGLSMIYEKYSLKYVRPGISEDDYFVWQKSGYLFLAPKLDVAIGHKRRIHFFLSLGGGLLIDGTQSISHRYIQQHHGTVLGYGHETHNTSDLINEFILRAGFGFTEHINLTKRLTLTISEEFALIPSSMSHNGNAENYSYFRSIPDMRTNYFSLQLGLSHNYGSIKPKDPGRLKAKNERKDHRLKKREKTTKTFSGAKFW